MKITAKQSATLIEFMKTKPELCSGKFTPSFTYKHSENMWKELTTILNSIPGPEKDWKNWRKSWQDIRSRTKLKASKINRLQSKTGGGPVASDFLSPTEEDVLQIITPMAVAGEDGVAESVIVVSDGAGPSSETEHVLTSSALPNPMDKPLESAQKKEAPVALKTFGKRKGRRTERAADAYEAHLKKKEEIKKEYYKQKIELLEKQNKILEDKNKRLEERNIIYKNGSMQIAMQLKKIFNKK